MLRKTLAVLAGLVAAVGIFMGFENIGGKLYPAPTGFDRADHKAMTEYVNSLPLSALWLVLGGWVVGSFVCGFLIKLISKSPDKAPPFLAGLFLMCAGIVDIFLLPHPLWFIITGIVIFIPMTLLGHAVLRPKH